MAAERTRTVSGYYPAYLKKKKQNFQTGKKVIAPFTAMTFDRVEFSSPVEKTADYTWLSNYIHEMSNEEVARKMKVYRDSFSTVDDAMTDKLLLELL